MYPIVLRWNKQQEAYKEEVRMIDLHMHSIYSDDGEFLPEQLVKRCQEHGIQMMAIADHNCVRANEAAQKAAQEAGICYIPAIEIDCTYENVNLHILGYNIDDTSKDFAEIEKNIDEQSKINSYIMLEQTQKLGFEITKKDMEEVSQDCFFAGHWTGEMFAEVLLNKPEYKNHPLLEPYRPGGSRSTNPFVNFYWDFYAQGKPCYAPIHFPSVDKIINLIHKNHGYAVLAHPGINLKDHADLLDGIVSFGLDGIEAFSSYHTEQQAKAYYEYAGKKGLFVTAGSDYHGKTKPAIEVGGYPLCISKESLQTQLNIIKKCKDSFTKELF